MHPSIRDMARWAVGFAIFSAVYLAVGCWLIRRRRQGKAEGKPPDKGAGDP